MALNEVKDEVDKVILILCKKIEENPDSLAVSDWTRELEDLVSARARLPKSDGWKMKRLGSGMSL